METKERVSRVKYCVWQLRPGVYHMKFEEMQSSFSLAILHFKFIPKLWLQFCFIESFYSIKLYILWHLVIDNMEIRYG